MNATEVNTDRIVTDLKRVVRDSELLLASTADTVGDKAAEMRQRLAAAVEAAKKTCRSLEEKTAEGMKAADRTIREHPYHSMGAAFGVGVLIGALVMRK